MKNIIIIAIILLSTTAFSQNIIIWGDSYNGTLSKSNIDGNNVEVICTNQTNMKRVRIDRINSKIYWAATQANKIRSCNFDGSEIVDIISTVDEIAVVEIDNKHNKIFYTEDGNNTIKSCNFDGTGQQTIIENSGHVLGLGIDEVRDYIFWTNNTQYKIMRADIDGSNITTIFESPNFLFELVLDVKQKFIYFNNRTTDNIARISYEGTQYEEIHNLIIRADLSGGNREELVDYPASPLVQLSGLDIGTEDVTSLNSTNNDSQIKFYPNPCKTNLHIETNSLYNIAIYDITGKSALKVLNSDLHIIDLSSLIKGIYILNITTEKSSLTKKLIIE